MQGVESVTAEADKQRAQAREAALQEAQQYRVTLLAAARAAAAEEASRDAAPPASNHMERSTGVESSTQTGVSDEADGSMPRASDASARGSEIGLPAGGIGGEQGRRAADDAAAAEELARLQGLREEMQASTREQVAKEAAVQQEELAAARRCAAWALPRAIAVLMNHCTPRYCAVRCVAATTAESCPTSDCNSA